MVGYFKKKLTAWKDEKNRKAYKKYIEEQRAAAEALAAAGVEELSKCDKEQVLTDWVPEYKNEHSEKILDLRRKYSRSKKSMQRLEKLIMKEYDEYVTKTINPEKS